MNLLGTALQQEMCAAVVYILPIKAFTVRLSTLHFPVENETTMKINDDLKVQSTSLCSQADDLS